MHYRGRLKVAGDRGEGIPIEVGLEDIYLRLGSEGEALGQWRLDDVQVGRLEGNEFGLALDGERLVFVAQDPLDFAYTGVTYIEEISERLSRRWSLFRRKGRPSGPVFGEAVVSEPELDAEIHAGHAGEVAEDTGGAEEAQDGSPETDETDEDVVPDVEPVAEYDEPMTGLDDQLVEEFVIMPPDAPSEPPAAPEVYDEDVEQLDAEVEVLDEPDEPVTSDPPVDVEDPPVEVEDPPVDVEDPPADVEELEGPDVEDRTEPEPADQVEDSAGEAFDEELDDWPEVEEDTGEPEGPEDPSGELPVADDPGELPQPEETVPADQGAEPPDGGPGEAHPDEDEGSPLDLAALSAEVAESAMEQRVVESGRTSSSPPAPGGGLFGRRRRRSDAAPDDHRHDYQESRTVGGITRRICSKCGHVSFLGEDVYEEWP